jgi:hypothetical protein
MKTYHDDEWKCIPHTPEAKPTRAEEQERIDTEFSSGRMERDEWRQLTDEMSNPLKWTASGKL